MSKLVLHDVEHILCLGAHADDIEIGCGGSILRILSERRVHVDWIVFSGDEARKAEAEQSAAAFLSQAQSCRIETFSYRDGYFPSQWAEIKETMATISSRVRPDLVFTHQLDDRHQDHRVIAELTWNHFRGSQVILEYEIPKYEGGLQTPNFYVGMSRDDCERKVELLEKQFASQRPKQWYDRDVFWAMLRLRGLESGLKSDFAEGFWCRKLSL